VGARIAVPLGVLLPCLAVSLAALGAVATGVAMVSGTSGYLVRQADRDVLACAESVLSRGLVMMPGPVPPGASGPVPPGASGPVPPGASGPVPPGASGPVPPGACGVELLSADGQVLVPAADGGPVLPSGRAWLAAHLARAVTVPGAGSGGRWRMVIMAVRYQARRIPYVYGPDDIRYVVGGPAGPGQAGLTAVMAGLAGAGQITRRAAAGYAAAAGVVLVLLAGAALAAARAILRPLRPGPGFAEQEMSRRLGEVCLELRTSVSVVLGFARYCRERGTPPAAGLDRMMRRVADESARMDALLRELQAAPAPPAADDTVT
jgi:hypothetical protein